MSEYEDQNMAPEGTDPKRKPVDSKRCGRVNASIWPKDPDNDYSRLNVSFTRSYQDKEGKWQRSSNFDFVTVHSNRG